MRAAGALEGLEKPERDAFVRRLLFEQRFHPAGRLLPLPRSAVGEGSLHAGVEHELRPVDPQERRTERRRIERRLAQPDTAHRPQRAVQLLERVGRLAVPGALLERERSVEGQLGIAGKEAQGAVEHRLGVGGPVRAEQRDGDLEQRGRHLAAVLLRRARLQRRRERPQLLHVRCGDLHLAVRQRQPREGGEHLR